MKVFHFCIHISIASLQPLLSIRRLLFQNCSIDFLASHMLDDYETYPKNLSRWSFEQGRTNSFDQFIMMINYLGRSFSSFKHGRIPCCLPYYSRSIEIWSDGFRLFSADTFIWWLLSIDHSVDTPEYHLWALSDSRNRWIVQLGWLFFSSPSLIINTEPTECPPGSSLFMAEFPSKFNIRGFPTDINLCRSCHSTESRFWSNHWKADYCWWESTDNAIEYLDIDIFECFQIVDMADDRECDGADSLDDDALFCLVNSCFSIRTREI